MASDFLLTIRNSRINMGAMNSVEQILRMETALEKRGLPVPTQIERDYAYRLLPNTPLNKDNAHDYGALMFALGRRQITIEVLAWIKDNKLA